jgi:hypothetical protein
VGRSATAGATLILALRHLESNRVGDLKALSALTSEPKVLTLGMSSDSGVTTSGSQSLREDHWLVDFGVGREFGLGSGRAEWTLGVRVAIFVPN